MIILIRHGEKEYKNNKNRALGFDPPLTAKGKKEIRDKIPQLIEKYGEPKGIISSPFRRGRETAGLIKDFCKETKVILCPAFGEYLGNQSTILSKHLTSTTLRFYSSLLFEKNITSYVAKGLDVLRDIPDDYWIVTHGIMIKEIASSLGESIHEPDCFGGFAAKREKDGFHVVDVL